MLSPVYSEERAESSMGPRDMEKTGRGGLVKTEADMGAMCLQSKECQGLLAAPGETGMEQTSSQEHL